MAYHRYKTQVIIMNRINILHPLSINNRYVNMENENRMTYSLREWKERFGDDLYFMPHKRIWRRWGRKKIIWLQFQMRTFRCKQSNHVLTIINEKNVPARWIEKGSFYSMKLSRSLVFSLLPFRISQQKGKILFSSWSISRVKRT